MAEEREVEKGEGVEKSKLGMERTDSTRNIVNNIVGTVDGARWVVEISGGTLCKVYDYLSTMLYTCN